MKTYVVGGAIRDQLLGLLASDRDYVVVGSSPEEMHAKGFIPVGKDFPVFLHPQTKEEYALARTERKSGQGYKGFSFFTSPEVTLEQDLMRRDFTINALAQEVNALGELIGPIIDPYNGRDDLTHQVFRHVSTAFQEDPLRILRLGRFLARFATFTVAATTMDLVLDMVKNHELQYLVPERVWQEFSRGLLEKKPSRMLYFLRNIGVDSTLLPSHLFEEAILQGVGAQLDQLATASASLEGRLAILLCDLDVMRMQEWLEHLKVPTELKEFAKAYSRVNAFLKANQHHAKAYMDLLDSTDLWRKPARFMQFLDLAASLEMDTASLRQVMLRVQEVNAGQIAQRLAGKTGKEIAQAVYDARLTAIASVL